MTKKGLQEYQYIKAEKSRIESKINQLRLSASAPSAVDLTKASVTGGTHSDSVATAVEQLMLLEDDYNSALKKLAQKQLKIERAVSKLPPQHRLIISYRYIDGMSWTAISIKMNYSESHIYRLHAQALKKLKNF